MSDNRQELVNLVENMDANRVGILLDYAYELAKINTDKLVVQNNKEIIENIPYSNSIAVKSDLMEKRKHEVNNTAVLELMDFASDTEGIILSGHDEHDTGRTYKNDKIIRIEATFQNNTDKSISFYVTLNFYDKDENSVGDNRVLQSPKIRAGKGWKMSEECYIDKRAIKYDMEVEIS